jgi:hypothetical protein
MDGTIIDKLTTMIIENLTRFDGLSESNHAHKLVYFRVDGIIMLQGVKTKVTTQLI